MFDFYESLQMRRNGLWLYSSNIFSFLQFVVSNKCKPNFGTFFFLGGGTRYIVMVSVPPCNLYSVLESYAYTYYTHAKSVIFVYQNHLTNSPHQKNEFPLNS